MKVDFNTKSKVAVKLEGSLNVQQLKANKRPPYVQIIESKDHENVKSNNLVLNTSQMFENEGS